MISEFLGFFSPTSSIRVTMKAACGSNWMNQRMPLKRGAIRCGGRLMAGLSAFKECSLQQRPHPTVRKELRAWAIHEPVYQLALMNVVSNNEFPMELDLLLTADPDLTRLSRERRSLLFQLWAQRGITRH
jgi:hypothetical protein